MQHFIKKFVSFVKDTKKEISSLIKDAGSISRTGSLKKESHEKGSELKIKMPNSDCFVELGKAQIKRVYSDPVGPRLLVVIDESAELLKPSGVKNKEGKEEDQLKQEMAMIIQSLAQLGRSAGVHLIICTQRAEVAAIAGGNTRENSLALNTKVIVK